MRFLIEGRLRPACGLSPAEYFDLAVQDWEMVLGWLSSGVALAYGRPVSVPGGTLLVDVSSEADARSARRLPAACALRRGHGPPVGYRPRAAAGRCGGLRALRHVSRAGRSHWMVSSARARTDGGIVSPSVFAVLRLTTRSNFVGRSTGRSPGLAPLRIRST
jgi:hypothetical protein